MGLRHDLYISKEILKEYFALSERLRARLSLRQYLRWNSTLMSLLSRMNVVDPTPRFKLCRDPKDDAYLAVAHAIRAHWLVTGDKDLLSIPGTELKQYGLNRLRIITPGEFIKA